MSAPPLSLLSDPLALARLQVLLIPVHHPDAHVGVPVVAVDESQPQPAPLTEEIFEQWGKLFRRVQSLRGDEIQHASGLKNPGHRRGTPTPASAQDSPRNRFLPASAGGSISRTANANHVHLAYPTQPPAKHLYPLSLMRMSAFPLVVIGVAVEDEPVEGYSLADAGKDASPKKSRPASGDNLWALAFTQTLSAFLPPTAAFPLVKRLVLVPSTPPIVGSAARSPVSPSFPRGVQSQAGEGVVRRAPLEGADGWVQKLLGEVVGQVFGELGELATSLESPNGLKTLSGTLMPSLSATLPHPSPISSSPMSTHDDQLRINTTSPSPRGSGLVHSNSLPIVPTATMGQQIARALTPGGRPTSVQPPSAPPIQTAAVAQVPTPTSSSNPFRRSAALIGRSTSGAAQSPSIGSSLMSGSSGKDKYTTAPLTGIAGGRLLKLLGDMYLITGAYADAIKCYDDGAEKCRAVGDVLWEGLAREGRAVAGIGEAWEARDGSNLSTPFNTSPIPVEILTHYLSSLACLCRAPLPFPPTILSPAPQTPQASAHPSTPGLTLPATTPHPTTMGTGEGLLAYLYATLCLRISHFVLLIFAAGGWGSIALSSLMTHTLPRSFPPLREAGDEPAHGRSRRSQLQQLAIQSQLSRSSVLGHAEAALGPYRRALTKAEQLAVHVEVVWLARWLEMERKEAAATRQVVKLLANVLAEGREETQRVTRAGSANSTTFGSASQGVAIRRREMTEGNLGVMELIERVCSAFGIKLVDFEGEKNPTVTQAAKEVDEARFGWPEMQVAVMKEAIAVAEALPDHPSVVRLCVSALNSLHGFLTPGNQSYLAKLYPQAMNTIRRRAIDFDGIPWWLPGRIILSVEVASLPASRVPIEHARDELSVGKTEGRKDPFLYNPRLKAPEAGKTVLVANEPVDVFVTLQNVFSFDLEIQDLSLLTTGAPFVTSPLPLILPASSVQTVRVSGHAPAAGSLQIRGVNVRLMDGSSAEFLLPVIDSVEQKRDSKRRSRVQAEVMKTKRQGLSARQSMIVTEEIKDAKDTHRWLECTVVEEQPLLWIKKTSLSHGTIMLYNGETSTIKIVLENTSNVPVDFVKLSFEDSVSREAQHILAEGELSPEKAYELDNDSIQRPVFTWDNSTDLSIPPGGRATINVQCLGKVGCTDALIRIDYGYVNRQTDVFHTRQLTFPVLFTVYHTLECYALDLVSLRSEGAKKATPNGNGNGTQRSASGQFAKSSDDELRSVLTSDQDSVLFCVNVRNVFSVPFEVALGPKRASSGDASEDEDERPVVTRLVPPGATEHLVLPIPRQSLTLEERTRPIPLPSGRQFTVDKTKKTAEEVTRTRELFWFREKLLSMVSVSWREPGSLRSGHLSLADLPLSPAQLDTFRLDQLDVVLAVSGRSGAQLQPTDFIDLRITVSNNLERAIRPHVRLEALPTSSTGSSWSMPTPAAPRRVSSLPATPMPVPKTVAFDGVLSTTLPTLAPGESATHSIGAVLLASGSYSFRAAAEEVVTVAPVQPPLVCFSPPVTVDVA